jgi:tryptophanyl-tRNA synthetase
MKILYGIQPTGRIHLGNYLGGLKMAIEKKAEIMIAIHHAVTSDPMGKERIHDKAMDMAKEIEKLGGYPVSQDLNALIVGWQVQCVTPMSDLKRMTQFKDKGEGNVGLFTYPCLMAADIILSEADAVIVGEDQLQHMEFYRRTCKRLGIKKVAKTILTDTPRIMSIADPTKKMSKSLGDKHCLYLFDDPETNRKKVMKAPTTPEGIENLKKIAKGLGVEWTENYKESKERIIDALNGLKQSCGCMEEGEVKKFLNKKEA